VLLDPDYLHAWKALSELPDQAGLTPTERQEAVLNIIRLDPRQRHSHASLEHVRDARALWVAVERAATHHPTRPKSLLPLAAAAEAIKSSGAGTDVAASAHYSRSAGYLFGNDLRTPAHALLAMPAFQTVTRLLDAQ
jgi:hypothetical protein